MLVYERVQYLLQSVCEQGRAIAAFTRAQPGMIDSTVMGAARRPHFSGGYVEVLPDVCGGHPHIRGTRVKVSEIVSRHVHQGESVDDIVEALPQLTLAQVHAALAYYYDNHGEVEAELLAEDGFVLRMAGRYAPHLASARFRPTL
jgi:uncharacterized protein (DUF433 family)